MSAPQEEIKIQVVEPITWPQPGTLEEALLTGGLTLIEEISLEEFCKQYPPFRKGNTE